jgi:acetyl-CoA synthetase
VILTPHHSAFPLKAGSATLPFFGIDPVVLNPDNGKEIHGNDVSGVLALRGSWPGLARTVYGNHPRYVAGYLTPHKGYYFTGDGCRRDNEGYYWITGRVDDVLNVSGHRIGSAELESVLVSHGKIAEAAVVGIPHSIKGSSLIAFVTPRDGVDDVSELEVELKVHVRGQLGAFACPDHIYVSSSLPKTRSGKIMRRLLRSVVLGEDLGDTSTLSDPSVLSELFRGVRARL